MRNPPKQPLPPRLSQPDGHEARAPSGVVAHLEPEGFFEDAQDETRPALGGEAKKALAEAERRQQAAAAKAMKPIIDRDAETAAMSPNQFQQAVAKLQRQSNPSNGGPVAPRPGSSSGAGTGSGSNAVMSAADAIAQLQRQRESSPGSGNRPGSSANSANATGPQPRIDSSRSVKPPPMAPEDIPSAKDLASSVKRSQPSMPPPPVPMANPNLPHDTDENPALFADLFQPSTRSITSPMNVNQLGLKPGVGNVPLAPQRTPAPIAVVGGSNLRLSVPDRGGPNPALPLPPPPNVPTLNPAGFGPAVKTTPSATAASRPPGAMGSRPPGAMASRPPGATAGSIPPRQYDFARWSSPEINEAPNDGAPVTFQVYTAQDVAAGRGPMRSLPMIEPPDAKKSSSIAVKVGLGAIGVLVVLLTIAAVVLVSTDDPKRPTTPSASVSASAPPPIETTPVPLAPTVIGDPLFDPDAAAPATTSTSRRTKTAPAPPSSNKPSGGGGGAVAPPPGGGAVAPPPNPYGK